MKEQQVYILFYYKLCLSTCLSEVVLRTCCQFMIRTFLLSHYVWIAFYSNTGICRRMLFPCVLRLKLDVFTFIATLNEFLIKSLVQLLSFSLQPNDYRESKSSNACLLSHFLFDTSGRWFFMCILLSLYLTYKSLFISF